MKIYVTTLFLLFFHLKGYSQLTGDTLTGVRLSSFNASKQNNHVQLNWKVACRLIYADFEVQRSLNGRDFTTIHSFRADYLRCQSPFDFTETALPGPLFYRVKVGDIDGRFSTEKVVKISGRDISSTTLRVISPVNGNQLQVTVEATDNTPVPVQVLNASGNSLLKTSLTPSKGINQLEIPVNGLPAGLYFLHYSSHRMSRSVPFIKRN